MMIKFSRVLFLLLIVTSCIGEDVIDDFIEAELRILNPVEEVSLSEDYQFNVTYFNNVGEPDNTVNVSWSSSDLSIATISSSGLLTPLAVGQVSITAAVSTQNDNIQETFNINIVEGETTSMPVTEQKSGTIRTTSSYLLEGSFTLSETQSGEDLILEIDDDYRASTALPGLYLYLSNNPNSIGSAYEVGAVETFNGSHNYSIPNTGINDYSNLLYWCKPFNVKVGDGEILDD